MCDVGATIYTLVWLYTQIRAFHGAIHTNTVKVFHEGRPVLHEGGPTQRMVLKALSESDFCGFLATRN